MKPLPSNDLDRARVAKRAVDAAHPTVCELPVVREEQAKPRVNPQEVPEAFRVVMLQGRVKVCPDVPLTWGGSWGLPEQGPLIVGVQMPMLKHGLDHPRLHFHVR